MCSSLSEQYARLVAFDDGHQHRGWPDRPYRSEGDNYSRIGIVLIVSRDDIHVGEACWHIEREPFLRSGKEFRSGDQRGILPGIVGHAIPPSPKGLAH